MVRISELARIIPSEQFITETLALYSLKKYRHLKRAYAPADPAELPAHDPMPAR